MRILLLDLGPKNKKPELPRFLERLCAIGNRAEVRRVGEAKSYRQVAEAFWISRDIAEFDLVITNEYFSAFGLCLRSFISRGHTKVAVVGFNVSRRYLATRSRLVNRFLNRVFRQLSLIIVHSRAEQELFSRVHDIPSDRFEVVLWGFDIPKSFQTRAGRWQSPFDGRQFVSMVGRNNRDFETLHRAVIEANVPAVIVTSSLDKTDLASSELVKVLHDLSFDDCLDVIQQSAVSVTLLKDDLRGAGHITVVSAMHLGRPQIFSDAGVLRDYVSNGEHGIGVPMRDAKKVRRAIIDLLSDAARCDCYGTQAKQFAIARLSDDAFQSQLMRVLSAFITKQKTSAVDGRSW
jgi:glycosyltransferase involved in cell wall biosynthesis